MSLTASLPLLVSFWQMRISTCSDSPLVRPNAIKLHTLLKFTEVQGMRQGSAYAPRFASGSVSSVSTSRLLNGSVLP